MLFKLGELFSGPGGLALGALDARVTRGARTWGVQHEWSNDMDADSCQTYRSNLCPGNPASVINRRVEDLDIESLPRIDAFAFGFPCNDFSMVGERRGFDGKFGPLYRFGVKVLNHFRPKWFVAENVSGLSNANSGIALDTILKDLGAAGEGYELTPHLYRFEDYGVAQRRHRIIIVGIAKKLGMKFAVPAPTSPKNPRTALEALTQPPISTNLANNELTRQSKTVVERLNLIPAGKNVWNAGLPKRLQLNVKGARLSQIYRRLSPNEPAYTVTGSGGGGTHVYHWKEPRALTNRERARLQSFPDTYVFSGSKESVRKQIGMAVPPLGAKTIVEAILKTFAGVPYSSVVAKCAGVNSDDQSEFIARN